MATYVLKIKYEDTLRRFTFESKPRREELSFRMLEHKIRDLFNLEISQQIRVTYNDGDGDVITMAEDQDLVDALIMQALNPLRLHVTLGKPRAMLEISPSFPCALPGTDNSALHAGGPQLPLKAVKPSEGKSDAAGLQQILKGLCTESVKQVLTSYDPLLNGGRDKSGSDSEFINMMVKHVDPPVGSTPIHSETAARPLSQAVPRTAAHCAGRGNWGTPSPFRPFRRVEAEQLERKSTSRFLHSHVQCDGCGMSPIAGPRFKSIVKYDYDLCLSCFKEMGKEGEYHRIDRPLIRPRNTNSPNVGWLRCPALNPHLYSGRAAPSPGPHSIRPDLRCYKGPMHEVNDGVHGRRLDARFMHDVTITDGTQLFPGTRFTKIWRLRNSGTLPWSQETKLVHVGGDHLGSIFIVPLRLPERGLLPNEEIEAGVDLIAPQEPGRYVSHWRLASPAGPNFGHRVWVLIQVVPEMDAPISDSEVITGLSDDENVTERTPLLSPVASSGTRDAFVKSSHDALVSSRKEEMKYPAAHVPPTRYMGPFGELFSDSLSVPVHEPSTCPKVGEEVDLAKDPSVVHCAPHSASTASAKVSDGAVTDVRGKCTVTDAIDDLLTLEVNDQIPVGSAPAPCSLEVSAAVLKEYPSAPASPGKAKEAVSPSLIPALKMEFTSPLGRMKQEEGMIVEHSELGGGFSMVEMPSDTVNQINTAPSTPKGESEVPLVIQSNTPIHDDEPKDVESDLPTPETLSAKLEAMGLTDRKLNVELLVKNQMDLRRTLDDLFLAAEWDPILRELEEMGFGDTEMNRRLMFKNNGSVKRVVKELVQICKEPAEDKKGEVKKETGVRALKGNL